MWDIWVSGTLQIYVPVILNVSARMICNRKNGKGGNINVQIAFTGYQTKQRVWQ